MAIVCTGKKTIRLHKCKLAQWLLAFPLLLPLIVYGAAPPTAAQCNAALVIDPGSTTIDFGTFLFTTPGSPASITIAAEGAVSSTNITFLSSFPTQVGVITASTGALDCSKQSPTVTFTAVGSNLPPSSTMTVSSFTYTTISGKKNQTKFTGTFYIGATLSAAGTEGSGLYTGTVYNIDVVF